MAQALIRRWSLPLFLATLLYMGLFETRREEDTNRLVFGAQGIIACISEGIFTDCTSKHPTADFSPLQYLPAIPLELMGVPPLRTGRILGYLSIVAFLLMLRTLTRNLSNLERSASITARIVLLTGPLLWYSRSSFGETLAAWITLHFAVACARPRTSSRMVSSWFFVAALSKETAFPFLALLGWAARPQKHRLLPLLAGAALSLAVNLSFNQFRYGTWANAINMQPLYRVPDLTSQISNFLGIWFSPTSGLLFFWPSFVILLGWGIFHIWKTNEDRWLAPAVALTLGGLTTGFSLWFAPFGWCGWGPRLILPWLPALIFLILRSSTPSIQNFARLLSDRKLFHAVLAGLVLVSVPQYLILFSQKTLDKFFFPETHGFAKAIVIQEDAPYYFQGIRQMTWTSRTPLIELYRKSLSTWLFPAALLFAAMLYSELSRMRSLGIKLCSRFSAHDRPPGKIKGDLT